MYVGCGTCKACLTKMANRASYMCALHELDYKYCMFVTLTYDMKSIPQMLLEENRSDGPSFRTYDCYDNTPRLKKMFGQHIGEASVSDSYLSFFRNKILYFPDSLPYLSRYDAQCFLKRFNKHIKKLNENGETPSYYLVGEYGPRHFRPHFHVLYFFNSDKTLQAFGQALYKSWTFGRVDYSLSRGKSNSYVAKYVNCRYNLPSIYCDYAFRPFCLHSQHFAQSFYKSKKAEIYENVSDWTDRLIRPVNGQNKSSYAWRSLVACFFPKCRGYRTKNDDELSYTYLFLQSARSLYGQKVISQYTDDILSDLIRYGDSLDVLNPNTARIKFLRFIHTELFRYENDVIIPLSHGFSYSHLNASMVTSIKQVISSLLYLSNHFITFVCDGDVMRSAAMIKKIQEFYVSRDYQNLKNQYELQESVMSEFPSDVGILFFLYDNIFPQYDDDGVKYFVLNNYEVYLYSALRTLYIYSLFETHVNEVYNRSQKHKAQNDANDIFFIHN